MQIIHRYNVNMNMSCCRAQDAMLFSFFFYKYIHKESDQVFTSQPQWSGILSSASILERQEGGCFHDNHWLSVIGDCSNTWTEMCSDGGYSMIVFKLTEVQKSGDTNKTTRSVQTRSSRAAIQPRFRSYQRQRFALGTHFSRWKKFLLVRRCCI